MLFRLAATGTHRRPRVPRFRAVPYARPADAARLRARRLCRRPYLAAPVRDRNSISIACSMSACVLVSSCAASTRSCRATSGEDVGADVPAPLASGGRRSAPYTDC